MLSGNVSFAIASHNERDDDERPLSFKCIPYHVVRTLTEDGYAVEAFAWDTELGWLPACVLPDGLYR